MTSLHNSLAEISRQYTVFVKDQVLTAQQLNTLSAYLDDEGRLTRTALTGIGIIEGLVVKEQGKELSLSRGLGITTDGDLMVNHQPQRFDRYKNYPEKAPIYAPFMIDDERIPLYQLVEKGQSDEDAQPLGALEDQFSEMVFLLLAETYVQTKDICTDTDCDNNGHLYTNTTRLLATPAKFVELLLQPFPDTTLPLDLLPRAYLPAIAFKPSINTQNEWFGAIREACTSTFKQLQPNLTNFWKLLQPYLQTQFEGNPSNGWVTRLTAIHSKAATETTRLQYYYEFLGDLCDSWNALIDALADLELGYLIPPGGGDKHLLLGGLDGRGGRGERTGFYPSPAHSDNSLEQVRFQLAKITSLLNQFGWTNISALKVTPSSHTHPSVPGYYQTGAFEHWSYEASRQGKNRYLLGYHADKNNPRGGAENPLLRRQSGFDFFRIEGVIGKNYASTESTLRKLIRQHHLPFSVTGTLVEGSFDKVLGPIFKPRWGLKDFQYLLKQDLTHQLQEVTEFSGQFRDAVIKEADAGKIRDGDVADVKTQARTRDAEINRVAKKSLGLLSKPKLTQEEQLTFNADISLLMKNSGLFKNDVAKVSNTHFPTSFDQLIVNRTPIWVDWIDRIDKEQDKKDTEKHLLPNFVNAHPGMEVMNGVPRGGSFVLLYNSSGIIVGSAMLSHYIEPVQQETVRPELPKFEPPFKAIPIPGIKVLPSLEFEFEHKFTDFGANLNLQIDEKIQFQSVYGDVFKDSLGIVRDLYIEDANVKGRDLDIDSLLGDPLADAMAEDLLAREKLVDSYNRKIRETDNVDERKILEEKRSQAQEKMAESIVLLAEYAANDTTMRGEGGTKAVETIVMHSDAIKGNQKAIDSLKLGINNMGDSAVRTDLASRLGGRFGGF
ncbi:hypothetical protein ACFSJ3_12705 [Corallincola platygyrae]|uniref:Uncharacterized protein n=1 Tax=Corallincola platygyrae TaxID=1193278 RepID=A0ABW4XPV9_9GAMM